MYFSVYLWVVPVILLARRRAARALSAFLALVLVGATLCGALALAAFAAPPLRAFFFSATEWARSARIYFDAASVYVLVLPIALLLAGSKSAGRLRLLGLVSSLFMIGSMVVTQTRTLMAATAVNVILVALLPGMWKLGVRRWRIAGSVALIVLVFVIALPVAGSLGMRSATILPQELAQRFSWIDSVTSDPNYEYRQVQVDIAMGKWQESPVTIVSGQGLGAAMGMPGRAPESPWVDNAWATLAAQGGLIALAPFALVLVGAFVSFVRVARSPAEPLERLIARALAVSLPLLLVDSTLFTMHLIHSPGVVVGALHPAGRRGRRVVLPPRRDYERACSTFSRMSESMVAAVTDQLPFSTAQRRAEDPSALLASAGRDRIAAAASASSSGLPMPTAVPLRDASSS